MKDLHKEELSNAQPITGTLTNALHSQSTEATLAVKEAIESMAANITSMLKYTHTAQTIS